MLVFVHRNGFITALRRIDLHLCTAQQVCKDSKVDRRVIDNQHLCMRCGEFLAITLSFVEREFESLLIIADRIPFDHLLFEVKGEDRALPVFTLNLKAAAHHGKEALRDGHAKSRSFDAAVSLFLNTLEGRKQPFHIFGLDTDAGIGNTDLQNDHIVLVRFLFISHGKRYGAFLGILHGI